MRSNAFIRALLISTLIVPPVPVRAAEKGAPAPRWLAGAVAPAPETQPPAGAHAKPDAPADTLAVGTGSRATQAFTAEVEPNGNAATATPIANTTVVEGNVFPNADIDFFSFTVAANDVIYAGIVTSFSANASVDSTLDIINSDGTTVIETDVDNGAFGSSSSSIAGLVMTTGGTKYARIVHGAGSQLRPYRFYLTTRTGAPTPETEPNDTFPGQALPAGGWVSGATSSTTEFDWFNLTLNAGDTVFASLDLDPERDTVEWNGTLGMAPFGAFSFITNDAGSAGPDSEAFMMSVHAAGTYAVRVNTQSGATTFGTYTLSVTVIPQASQALCTTYTSTNVPQTIPTGPGSVTSTLTIPGNPVIADLRVNIDLTHANMADLDVTLVSPAGNENALFTDLVQTAPPQPIMNFSLADSAAMTPSFGVYEGARFTPELDYRTGWFKNELAGGTWTLTLRDDTAANGGTLNNWSITICEPPPLPSCGTGTYTATAFSTDFESGAAGFTHSGTLDEWELGLPTAQPFTTCNSGVACWKTDLDNTYENSANYNLISAPISLAGMTGPIRLRWAQRYNMESASFDHYSVDVREVGNPTNSRRLFEWLDDTMTEFVGSPSTTVQMSAGWANFTGDISSLAGLNVEIVFHIDTDSSVQNFGVAIDDVSITGCITCPTITITPSTLPNGTVGTPYNQTLIGNGGVAPYTFAVTAGALPTGTSLAANGDITGTPTATGTFNFTVTATDTNGCTGSQAYTVNIGCPTITLSPPTLPNGSVGTAYNQTITASGGTPAYTFAVTAGALPTGLSLATTGQLTGTPTATGTFNFTVTATDSFGCTGTQAYSIDISGCPPSLPVPELMYYKFNETGTGFTDNLASSPVGTDPAPLLGALTMGGAGQFNAGLIGSGNASTTDYVNTGWAPNLGTGSWTISLWMTEPANSTTLYYYFGDANTASFRCFTNGVAGDNNLLLRGAGLTDTYINGLWDGSGAPAVATYVYDSSLNVVKGFRNGVLVSTVAQGAPNLTGAGPFKVCGYATNVGLQGGQLMDEFRLYNRALSDAEVLATFGNELGAGANIVLSPTTLPNGTAGTAYSQTITASGGTAPYTFAITSGALPTGLSLSTTGDITGTPTATGSFTFEVTATDANTCTGSQSYTVDIGCGTIALAPTTLPNGQVGTAYSQTITASGGLAPYTFAVSTGAVPPGLTLAANGDLTGTPTTPGTFLFDVTATDAAGCTGVQSYSMVIDCPVIALAPATLPNGVVGTPYSQTITASGGTAPYTFAVSAGTLPAGLSLAANGDLTGTPTTAGSSTFDVTATDATGCTGVQSYTLVIDASCPAITLAPATLPNGNVGIAYSQTITASGGTAPYTFAVSAGTLPTGLTLAANGDLTGTPTAPGSFTFDVTATDADSCTGTQTYTIDIGTGSCNITILPATLPMAQEGQYYAQLLTAIGGVAPYTFVVSAGALPPGLVLNDNGILSGTPTAIGTYNFTVTATDQTGCTATTTYDLVVGQRVAYFVGAGLGAPNANRARVFRADGTATSVDFLAYGAGQWGTNVATGDINGGNHAELLTGPGPGDVYGPQVRAFQRDGVDIPKVNFFAYGTLKYGVNVTGAYVDGDAFSEMVTGPGPGPVFGPHVRGWNFDGSSLTPIQKINFFAYSTLKYGVNVTAGSVDADGFEELVTGPGPGDVFGSQIRGWNYDDVAIGAIAKINFNAFTLAGYGVNVASGQLDGDAFEEIAATPGPGPTHPSRFLGFDFDGAGISPMPGFDATPYATLYGGRVGVADVSNDGREDLLTGAGRDSAADSVVKAYDYTGALTQLSGQFVAFGTYAYGVNVSGGKLGY